MMRRLLLAAVFVLCASSGWAINYQDGGTSGASGEAGAGAAVGSPITGGTANRVLFNDGSGNLADDADMTFVTDKITVTKTSTTLITMGDLGSNTTPSITFAGDLNTGIYSQGNDNVNIAAGGVGVARFQSGSITAMGTNYFESTSHVGTATNPTYTVGNSGNQGMYVPTAGDGLSFAFVGARVAVINKTTATFMGVIVSTGGLNIGVSGQTILRHLSGTASLDFGATAAGTCDSLTITVTGAADGDTVALGVPNALAASDTYQSFDGFVSGANTVTVKRCNLLNLTTALSNAAAATVRADVWQH